MRLHYVHCTCVVVLLFLEAHSDISITSEDNERICPEYFNVCGEKETCKHCTYTQMCYRRIDSMPLRGILNSIWRQAFVMFFRFFFFLFWFPIRFVDTTIRVCLCMTTEFIFARLVCLQSRAWLLMLISVKLSFDYILRTRHGAHR